MKQWLRNGWLLLLLGAALCFVGWFASVIGFLSGASSSGMGCGDCWERFAPLRTLALLLLGAAFLVGCASTYVGWRLQTPALNILSRVALGAANALVLLIAGGCIALSALMMGWFN